VQAFAERGYQGTRVEDVAAELGISKSGGFWSVLVYWLERTEHLVQENRAPYLVTLIGS
jgi:hypothetical protein